MFYRNECFSNCFKPWLWWPLRRYVRSRCVGLDGEASGICKGMRDSVLRIALIYDEERDAINSELVRKTGGQGGQVDAHSSQIGFGQQQQESGVWVDNSERKKRAPVIEFNSSVKC